MPAPVTIGARPGWRRFADFAGVHPADYPALWQWSVDKPAALWRAVWDFSDVVARDGTAPGDGDAGVLGEARMPGARWFPGVRLNYVDQVLRHVGSDGAAIVGVDEAGAHTEIRWRELPGQVGAVAAALRELGVGPGDTVAAYLPDVAEAMVACLATAAVGAVWSACGQDYAPEGAAARLGPLAPVVLFGGSGYRFGGTWIDKGDDTARLRTLLPGEPPVISVGGPGSRHGAPSRAYADIVAHPVAPVVDAVAFDHPLWVLFTSGTTGRPKGIVHGHGGVLLEHLKAVGLHAGLGPRDVFFWHTSLSWMMWNFRLAGLLVGATTVCYSGHPLRPTADRLWQLLATKSVSYFGTSPGQLLASRKAGLRPGADHDLSALHTVGSTGSPLPADLVEWVGRHVGDHVAVSSISGGTDVVSAFAGGTRGVDGRPGELATRYLGVALHSWSPERTELVGEVGELVITAAMPSMPVAFTDDPDGARYRAAYFEHEWADGVAPGVWRHGDWVTVTDRGSVIVHGRSDATLNRHGVRMGSADIYEVVEAIDTIAEAFVLGVDGPGGTYWMPLFITLVPPARLDDTLVRTVRSRLRSQLSPRHVPDEVIEAPGIPHTRTGKKLEVPVTAVLAGRPVEVDRRSVDDPALIDWYAARGRAHRWSAT